MALVPCPECGRQVSTAAAACPQCGHPLQAAGPRCYACEAAATTRCQSCGALSCPEHLQSIYVPHGRGGAYELRCGSCFESAKAWKMLGCMFAVLMAVIGLIILVNLGIGPFER